MNRSAKIIALDDDPTGSQTVHGCLLLLAWDVENLRAGLRDASPLLFILGNTRARPAAEAEAVTREICQNLRQALDLEGITDWVVVSRSDSTLRGHYPLETDVIAAELGPFDAHFLVPAFIEGGRTTRDSIHYLQVAGRPVPVHETEFAQDSVFGFHHSYLPDYVAEKTGGRIPAESVVRLDLAAIRQGVTPQLLALQNNSCAVVDAETQADLRAFAAAVWSAQAQDKRFLFRSAAGLVSALADLPPQPVPPDAMAQYVRHGRPGVFIVGSHVPTSTQQLTQLLAEAGTEGVEIPVAKLLAGASVTELLEPVVAQVNTVFAAGRTAVVYTTRGELTFPDPETRLRFGQQVSALTAGVVQHLPTEAGYLISKGGITSNDVLSQGLSLRAVRLLGQILPGVNLLCTDADHPRLPNLPVGVFPGNVGGPAGLVEIYRRLQLNG